MNNEQRINKFNRENRPFYIVDYEDGHYGLCFPFTFLKEEYKDFGQEAFDRYALEIGDPIMDHDGMITHGNGYEWQAVFEKAFEDDPESSKIDYDCEAGGFYCRAKSLSVMMDFGARFRAICMDGDKFAQLVSIALKEREEKMRQAEEMRRVLRGFLQNTHRI